MSCCVHYDSRPSVMEEDAPWSPAITIHWEQTIAGSEMAVDATRIAFEKVRRDIYDLDW